MPGIRTRFHRLVSGLWFLPLLVAVGLGAAAFGIVQLDQHVVGHGTSLVFGGGTTAARTVLSTLAGSLITVAGLTFSITMLLLQMASSQFSPRVLPTVMADRVTQLTVGTFVGIFIFCLIGLRSVGGVSDFVPRLTVTVGSALAVLAVMLLVVFLHHVSTMVGISHVAARIARDTLRTLDQLYPDPFGDDAEQGGSAEVERRRAQSPPGVVRAQRPGYVQRVDVDALAERLRGNAELVHVTVAPGDFASAETAVLEVWPAEVVEDAPRLSATVVVGDERDLVHDASFGVRQLTDVALRAISPGVNDPTTAVTCIGYIRSILERVVGRALPPELRRFEDARPTVVARRVDYREYLGSLVEIARYSQGDTRLLSHLARACHAVRTAAEQANAGANVAVIDEVAAAVGDYGRAGARTEREREAARALFG